MSDDDLLLARRKALETEKAEAGGKPRMTPRPPLNPLAARARAIQDRLAEAYQQRRRGRPTEGQ